MIFLSYNHQQAEYADCVEQYLNQRHMAILRDTRHEKTTDRISEFMGRISQVDDVILLVSDAYLKSYCCLNEALMSYSQRETKAIIPIICPDAQVFRWEGIASYLTYWQQERDRRKECMAQLPASMTVELQKELRQVEAYVNYLGDFLAYLKDCVCILQSDGSEALEQLYHCLCGKILDREVRMPCARKNFKLSQIGDQPLVAIDFGTSYTLASVLDEDGEVHLIPDHGGNVLHRSTVEFLENGGYRIGTNGPEAVRHIKCSVGVRDFVEIGNEPWSVTLLVAMILRSVIRDAEEYTGAKIGRILMSLPTDFSLMQKKFLNESARLAGVEVLRFVQESSVESYLAAPAGEYAAAFIDLGGGTLDVSMVEVSSGVYDVSYTDGDSRFGSLEFDRVMEKLLRKKLLTDHGITVRNLSALAEQAKCQLGSQPSVCVIYQHHDEYGDVRNIPLTITRGEFEAASRKWTEQFQRTLDRLSTEAKCSASPLRKIYLTGQGTKLFVLKDIIAKTFPAQQIVDAFQESAVIRGLSGLKQKLSGLNNDALVLATMPGSVLMKCSNKTPSDTKDCILSNKSNPADYCLVDFNTTIPVTREGRVEFGNSEEKTPQTYPLEILEVTPSGHRVPLIRTVLNPAGDSHCTVRIESDANFRITITVRGYPSGGLMCTYQF